MFRSQRKIEDKESFVGTDLGNNNTDQCRLGAEADVDLVSVARSYTKAGGCRTSQDIGRLVGEDMSQNKIAILSEVKYGRCLALIFFLYSIFKLPPAVIMRGTRLKRTHIC